MSLTAPAGSFGTFPEHVADLISQALRLFAFEYRGKAVRVDSMRLRGGGKSAAVDHARGIHYEPVLAYRHGEPRIGLFVDLFTHVLASFSFYCRGEPVEVDGVRLVNLAQWSRYRFDSLLSNLSPITSVCSARCLFCYRAGSLNGRLLGLSPRILGVDEARTRARYWQPDTKLGLPFHRSDLGEPFANRRIFDILDIARHRDADSPFTLSTNGDYLDRDTVRRLSAYQPLVIALSLNTADLAKRSEVMRPLNAENGARAPDLLREAAIPYVGSIAADQRLGLADIERTIRYLDERGALMIRVLLPGYTKYSADRALPGLDQWWRQVTELVLAVRKTVESPVLASPALYWDTETAPTIEGLHKQSIAKRAGLRIGDVVLAVNGIRVLTKAEVIRLLERSHAAGRPCRMRVKRGDEVFDTVLRAGPGDDRCEPAGLESELSNGRYGIFMNRGLDLDSLAWIRSYLNRFKRSVRALMFSTPLAQPHLLRLAEYLKDFGRGHDLRTTIAEHAFWGGNIQIGDLHVVGDYVQKIDRLVRKGWRPDLVFIPSSFLTGGWGFDVAGSSYRRIETETGVQTVLVPVTRIME